MDDTNKATIGWLLASEEPWVVYNTLIELVGTDPDDSRAREAYGAMQAHPQVVALMESLDSWPTDKPLSKAYDPKDSIWKLGLLADFGLGRDDERIAGIAERVLGAQADDGGFLHGGFDHTKSWHTRPYICISHVMTYALARFGYLGDARLGRAYGHIVEWQRLDGGWHPNKLNLPGNERESEPSCPFGTLNVLRAVVAHPGLREGEVAQRAVGYLLTCWERRSEPYRPVGFGIGATWNKVQYPFVQYQLLKTVDTLSQAPAALNDPRYREMLDLLESKRDAEGRWTAERVNKPYSEFDFGQRKQSSAWITFLALRVVARSRS
ncbi:MAG TPA: hypothetical protein VGE45_18140 [Chloroflexia bacterium]|jgi:hypothetical protein